MAVTAAVYTKADLDTPVVADLDLLWAPKWRDPKSDVGTFSLNVQNDDPDLAELTRGRIVRFAYDGNPAFQGIIERRQRETVAADEEAGQYTVVSGDGIAARLDAIRVWPETPPGSQPWASTRYFNFASVYLDRSAWTTPIELQLAGAGPANWPDPTAFLIWSRDYVSPPPYVQPSGTSYFAKTLTTGDVTVRLSWSCDDFCEVWVDGIPQGRTEQLFDWQKTFYRDLKLSAGDHLIAASVSNQDPTFDGNIAWFLCAVHELQSTTAELGTLLLHSDDTWLALDYPAEPPGFTAGEILNLLIEEANLRGCVIPILTFNNSTDTDSNSWVFTPDVSVRVGMSILDVLRQLTEQFIDWRMSPTGYELNCWVRGGLFVDSGFTLTPGTDLRRLKHTEIA